MSQDKKPDAAAPEDKALPEGKVRVRVLKAGDGKVFKGDDDNSTYAKGDEFLIVDGVAKALENAGLVDIL